MFKLKILLLFPIVFAVVNVSVFWALVIGVPGFPFFPTVKYKTSNQPCTVHLEKGGYYVLYYIESNRDLPISRADVGPVDVTVSGPSNVIESIQTAPSYYYFDYAPNRYGIRGHSVCSFKIANDEDVTIKGDFRKYGYDGLIVRVRLKSHEN